MATIDVTTPKVIFTTGASTLELDLAPFFAFLTVNPVDAGNCDCRLYSLPYLPGDFFTFQISETITTVELLEDDGTDVTAGVVIFGTDDKFFSLDTTGFTTDRFHIKLNNSFCFEFNFEITLAPEKTILIEGIYAVGATDFSKRVYDEGYSNKLRLLATTKWTGKKISTITDGEDRQVSKTVQSVFDINLNVTISENSWLLDRVIDAILLADQVVVTLTSGVQHTFLGAETNIDKNNESSSAWFLAIKLSKAAQTITINCN